jgi:hypothetical protein
MIPGKRLEWVQSQTAKLELASNLSMKDGPTYISTGIKYRTVYELLNSGFFPKEPRTGYTHLFVLYEVLQEPELSEDDNDSDVLSLHTLASKTKPKPKVKLKPKVKMESKVKMEPKVKMESKVKMEPKVKPEPKIKPKTKFKVGSQQGHKRGISQVSPSNDDNQEEGLKIAELQEESDLESLSDIIGGEKPYGLRKRT